MEPGDVVVFKEVAGWTPYSHIAMFHADAGGGYGWFYGQNQGGAYYSSAGGACFNLCKLPYSATYDTAFRPKCFVGGSTTTTSTTKVIKKSNMTEEHWGLKWTNESPVTIHKDTSDGTA